MCIRRTSIADKDNRVNLAFSQLCVIMIIWLSRYLNVSLYYTIEFDPDQKLVKHVIRIILPYLTWKYVHLCNKINLPWSSRSLVLRSRVTPRSLIPPSSMERCSWDMFDDVSDYVTEVRRRSWACSSVAL